ncbi:MAG: riboflavin synthase [Flavobacteriaceae bacterium]|jgi:riboflavin synthase|nr:riboflavin synthase [Flavobacteriaceae bacterium]NVJ73086.1 riboflavin synthase [Flavobacteriaceae bacterium]
MFTGIIETFGSLSKIEQDAGNIHFTITSPLAAELQVDQSVAHNGVCLTVVECDQNTYKVTAIAETLNKTNLGDLKVGDQINLERAMIMGSRLDGHIVQGHVDQVGVCEKIVEEDGSWRFSFSYDASTGNTTIEKGSITVDGTSLTVVDATDNGFSVAIIPYTFENTRFNQYQVGTRVNLEFDVLGKYVARYMNLLKK